MTMDPLTPTEACIHNLVEYGYNENQPAPEIGKKKGSKERASKESIGTSWQFGIKVRGSLSRDGTSCISRERLTDFLRKQIQ